MHLAATGLRGAELQLYTQPFQQRYYGTPGLWE
jgi:hypothetical protein